MVGVAAMTRWFGVAYLIFVAVVAGWLLTAISHGLARCHSYEKVTVTAPSARALTAI